MIKRIVENAIEQIADCSDATALRDNGKEIILSDMDRVAMAAAMEVARAVDEAYRAEEGIRTCADEFSKDGAWHRAANLLKSRLKLYGGDLAHRVLLASVRSKFPGSQSASTKSA